MSSSRTETSTALTTFALNIQKIAIRNFAPQVIDLLDNQESAIKRLNCEIENKEKEIADKQKQINELVQSDMDLRTKHNNTETTLKNQLDQSINDHIKTTVKLSLELNQSKQETVDAKKRLVDETNYYFKIVTFLGRELEEKRKTNSSLEMDLEEEKKTNSSLKMDLEFVEMKKRRAEELIAKTKRELKETKAELTIAESNSVAAKFLALVHADNTLSDDMNNLDRIEGALTFQPDVIKALDQNGNSALHIASMNKNAKLVKCLLTKVPESFNIKNASGYTAIEQAVLDSNTVMLAFLFDNRTMKEKIYANDGLLTAKLLRLATNRPASQINHYQTNNNNVALTAGTDVVQTLNELLSKEREDYTNWLNENCTSEIGHRALDKAITTLDKKQIRVAVKAMSMHGLLPATSKLTISSEDKNKTVTRKGGISETATDYMHYKAGKYSRKK